MSSADWLGGHPLRDAPLTDALELAITQVQRIVEHSAILAGDTCRRHTFYPSLEDKSARFAGDHGVSILRCFQLKAEYPLDSIQLNQSITGIGGLPIAHIEVTY